MPVYGCAEPSYIVSSTGRHDTITLFSHELNKIAVEILAPGKLNDFDIL